MRSWRTIFLVWSLFWLTNCRPPEQPVIETPNMPPIVADPPGDPLFNLPKPPVLSPAGETLVIEFEVGGKSGYNPHPELPDLRFSGVTWGIGYDAHQNSAAVILSDWASLSPPAPQRLAATHPYHGRSAIEPWKQVRDILVVWTPAMDVFNRVDVARTWQDCKHAFPGFDGLRPNAQAALVSLVFNRGSGMAGPNRVEMRGIRDLVSQHDYPGIAALLRKMKHIWVGTSIEGGMTRRREAEAKLVLTP